MLKLRESWNFVSSKWIWIRKKFGFNSLKSPNTIIALLVCMVLVIFGVYELVKIEERKITIAQNTAEEYYYQGNYDKAIEEYKKLYKKNPSTPWWNIKIAEIYSVKGDVNQSRSYLEGVKALKPTEPDVLNYIVFTELMNKDYGTALKDGTAALSSYPANKPLIRTMFTVYMFNDKIDTAKSLIMLYPVDNSSAYDLAEYSRMLITVEEWDKAFENLKKAWNIDKDEYKIYDVLAQVLSFNKDNVLEKISTLSSKNPDDICYKMWLAKVYSLDAATADTANKYLTDLKKSSVGKIEIKLIEAAVLQNLNKEKEADDLISNVIKENPNDYRIFHTAGWYYLNKNKLDVAEKYCKESIVKNKDYPDNYSFLMPAIMEKQGKIKEAEPYFRIGISKEPYNYNIMLSIAEHYLQVAKDSNKAMEYYRFAEKIRPKDAEIKYSIAFIYIHDGKQNEAIDMLNQCIAINESIPKYHRTLGAIYLLQGKNDEGIQQTRLAYSLDERDILTLNNAGVYYLTVSVDMDKSLANIKSAFEGISASTDQYTKDTITSNYNKVKKLVDDYNNSKGNEDIKIPELTLFY